MLSVLQKGTTSYVVNYRSTAVSNNFSKVVEFLIHNSQFLKSKLNSSQNGFIEFSHFPLLCYPFCLTASVV
jgi:hypothetical protein